MCLHTPTGKHICVCAREHRCPLGPEVAHPPRDGVTGPCKLPDVSAGKQTRFLCKNRVWLLTAEPSVQPFQPSLDKLSGGHWTKERLFGTLLLLNSEHLEEFSLAASSLGVEVGVGTVLTVKFIPT